MLLVNLSLLLILSALYMNYVLILVTPLHWFVLFSLTVSIIIEFFK